MYRAALLHRGPGYSTALLHMGPGLYGIIAQGARIIRNNYTVGQVDIEQLQSVPGIYRAIAHGARVKV